MPQFLARYDALQNFSIMGDGKHDFLKFASCTAYHSFYSGARALARQWSTIAKEIW